MTRSVLVSLLVLLQSVPGSVGFEFHAPGQRPEVTRKAIAGLWKVTPALRVPMKEFTVHGRTHKDNEEDENATPELLLMLKEDGSFQEYSTESTNDGDGYSIQDSWKRFKEKRKAELAALAKGTWDYRDGKLILAADRPTSEARGSDHGRTIRSFQTSAEEETEKTNQQQKQWQQQQQQQYLDTLLEGRVIARYETSLPDNPVLEKAPDASAADTDTTNTTATSNTANSHTTEKRWDAHLAVQKATVKVGKFFYPKHHPSFFELPIYNPDKRGAFQLRQILGSLNTNLPDQDTEVEKFQRSDFYNKTFVLTSHPLGQRRPKGEKRWSIKQNKFVEDPPSNKAAKKYAEDMENNPVKIRVMQVRFFPNNTFATIGGTGDAILRGKFDVIGQDKDSLWMHISRFGFGRSVSGSVFSEGRMLSHDDAKSYWGTIRYQSDNERHVVDGGKTSATAPPPDDDKPKPLEVQGSVLFGSGLEPTPVGRFIMRETDESWDSLLDEEEEDEEDEEADPVLPEMSSSFSNDILDEDGVDLSSDDAFQ
jgi:hypothetical protein